MSILKAYRWKGTKSRTLSMSHSGQWKNFVCQPIIHHDHFEFSIKIRKYSQPAGSGFLSIGLRGIGVFGGGEEDYVWMDSSSPGFKKGDQITVVAQKKEKLVRFKKNGKKTLRDVDVDSWPARGFEILPSREEILKMKEVEETKRMEAMEIRLLEEEKRKEKERQEKMRKDQEKWAFEERIKGTELQRQVEDLLVAFEKLRREHEELKKEHENTKNELDSTKLTLEEVKSDYLEHKENHKNIN